MYQTNESFQCCSLVIMTKLCVFWFTSYAITEQQRIIVSLTPRDRKQNTGRDSSKPYSLSTSTNQMSKYFTKLYEENKNNPLSPLHVVMTD